MQLVVVVALILIGVLVWAIGDYSSKKSAEKEENNSKIRDVTVPGAETKRRVKRKERYAYRPNGIING